MYGPGLSISDFNLGILYLLAVSALSTYGILLAGFFYLKISPFFMKIKNFNLIKFQEHLFKGQLEAKHILSKFIYYILKIKYVCSTTKINITNILLKAIRILGYFIVGFQILIIILTLNNLTWLSFIVLLYYIEYLSVYCIFISIRMSIGYSYYNVNKGVSYRLNKFNSKLAYKNINFSVYTRRFFSKTAFLYESKSTLPAPQPSSLFRERRVKNIDIELDKDLQIMHSLYIKDLFKDRVAPVIPFDSNLILAICNLGNEEERSTFLKEWGSKGGIYIIEYKYNPLIYYIGRTTLIKRRINNHIKAESNNKFHVFLSLIGIEHFKFSIIEICERNIVEQGKRENFYLQKFLPILNTTFSSSYSETAIYANLKDKLTNLKFMNFNLNNVDVQLSNKPIAVFVYSFNENNGISPTFNKYNSMAETCKIEKIAYNTLLLFRDTNMPSNGKLYYTKPIIDFYSALDRVKDNLKDIKINSNVAIRVWAYDAKTLTPLNGSPFLSKTQAADSIGISRHVINYFIDTKKPEGVKGTYLFSIPLEDIEIKNLKELSQSITLGNKVKVWAYDAKTWDLIENRPFSSIFEAANYFNVNYRTISRNLDTNKITKQNSMLVYLFKKEINLDLIRRLES